MEAEILVVEDEPSIAQLEKLYLESEGFAVRLCADGASALAAAEGGTVDLALLDVMLPDMDGFTLLGRLREKHLFPILMVTARVEDLDKITGLTLGADDYVTKPFNPLELVARVKTQLRRARQYTPGRGAAEESLETRERQISRETHKYLLYGERLNLTPLEFSILYYLCRNQGRVVSSEELFEAVWGEKYLDNNNTVMSHIARLREKMHEPSRRPRFIKTVWGVGYTIE